MEERYIRNIGPLTREQCERLSAKSVLVAGCGGLGGYIVELLLRLGAGAITVADGDCFAEHNLNRQLLADTGNIGRSKVEAAAARAERVNPRVRFTAVNAYLDAENAPSLLRGVDVAMDALDSIDDRLILADACEAAGIPLVHGAISGFLAQAAISLPGDGLLHRLYPKGAEAVNGGSLSFTPALCASMQTALAARLLCGLPVESGRLYFFDLSQMTLDAIF